jgi:hypothetical protein
VTRSRYGIHSRARYETPDADFNHRSLHILHRRRHKIHTLRLHHRAHRKTPHKKACQLLLHKSPYSHSQHTFHLRMTHILRRHRRWWCIDQPRKSAPRSTGRRLGSRAGSHRRRRCRRRFRGWAFPQPSSSSGSACRLWRTADLAPRTLCVAGGRRTLGPVRWAPRHCGCSRARRRSGLWSAPFR